MVIFVCSFVSGPSASESEERNDNQIVDDFIKLDITKWLHTKPKPHNVMIPSSNVDFSDIARKVKKKGHSFLMAYDDNRTDKNQKKESAAKLLKLAECDWTWRKSLGLPKYQLNQDLRQDNIFSHSEFLEENRDNISRIVSIS